MRWKFCAATNVGRTERTWSFTIVTDPAKPNRRSRSVITVAATFGSPASIAAICGLNASNCEPADARSYFGGSTNATSLATVFLLIDNFAAIAALLIPSTSCRRRTSAQSCTEYIPSPLDATSRSPEDQPKQDHLVGGAQHSAVADCSGFSRRRQAAFHHHDRLARAMPDIR